MKVFVKHCSTFLILLTITAVNTQYGAYNSFGNIYDPSQLNSFLKNLNSKINSQVNEHLNDVNSRVISQVNTAIPPFVYNYGNAGWNAWNPISPPVIPHINFDNLGQQITQQVQESLKPLRLRTEMTQGKGGTTVISYGHKLHIIVKDGYKYTCPGQMVQHPTTGVECTKPLVPYTPMYNDHCTTGSYSRVNGIYCFGKTILECINGACKCKGGQMYSIENLKDMCGPNFGTNQYVVVDYHPNLNDPNAIKYTGRNINICDNPDKSHCIWHATSLVLSNGAMWHS